MSDPRDTASDPQTDERILSDRPAPTGGMPAAASPEVDDSVNMTVASPELSGGEFSDTARAESGFGDAATAGSVPAWGDLGEDPIGSPGADASGSGGGTSGGASPVLTQLQTMIDNVATHATPVLREIAAKAAELAATAGRHAGPIAHRAAETTQAVGERVAAKGEQVAADLRRSQERLDGDRGPSGGADGTTDDAGQGQPAGEGDATGSERPGAAPQDPGI